ncbi:MAG: hypothetical protein AAFR51_09690 [Pseudomonadota bacterium]
MSEHPRLVSIDMALSLLATDFTAAVSVPPLDAPAMDGYAVRFERPRHLACLCFDVDKLFHTPPSRGFGKAQE